MSRITRRKFLEMAASFSAALALPSACSHDSRVSWRERRDLYPQGVASADPHPDSVILWTRRPSSPGSKASTLILEIAEDKEFRNVIASTEATVSAETDWTCRVLAADLKPRTVYWYRFTDEHGFGSRVGRTITAPSEQDELPVSFTFVSCQNVQQGACNAYRRMIWEDEKRASNEQLGFVLHLGDFVYEVVWYPEDRPQGMYDRRLRDIVRYPNGEKMRDFHVAVTLEDYRALYRAYLSDPDLQDARARWPFVCVWDNHEFSWRGWQSQQNFGGVRPAQKTKVAANQAWFEFQPARVVQPGNPKFDRFEPPVVSNAEITKFDEHGLGMEPGNLAAIHSLKIFRALRYGQNVELILTDNRSFRSEPVTDKASSDPFQPKDAPLFFPEGVLEILDAGRSYNGGNPPDTISFDGKQIPNPSKEASPQSVLGIDQKAWFVDRLTASKAPWKLWGNSMGMLDWRMDLQNLSPEMRVHWPISEYGTMGGDWTSYVTERAEILEMVKQKKITGFVTIAGDRHSFFAGVLSVSLPPKPFVPVAAEFITGSVSAPGIAEALPYIVTKDDPLKSILLYEPSNGSPPQAAINFSILNGVRSSLALQHTHKIQNALAEKNPNVSPHLSFADLGGHGYSMVRASNKEMQVEFVCIPRPIERSQQPDGGSLSYRVVHSVKLWKPGEAPRLKQTVVEGALPFLL